MKKPFWYAFAAAVYIVVIVLAMNAMTSALPAVSGKTIFIPMVMLGLFVLSAAIMGFLFLSEPLRLYMENQKREATIFFCKIVGIFACFVILSLILFFFL